MPEFVEEKTLFEVVQACASSIKESRLFTTQHLTKREQRRSVFYPSALHKIPGDYIEKIER